MIIEFSVGNFRSIREMQTLSMTAANIVSKYKDVDSKNLINVSEKLSLLKSKAIYGANASGKSNLIRGLVTFIAIVNKSVKDDRILEERIENFKLSTETENVPTFFQLTFILNEVLYRYGFEATSKEIVSEWLFGSPGKKEVPFFTREGRDINVNENKFKEGNKFTDLFKQEDNDIARSNSLFLTSVKSFSGGLSKDIVEYISRIFVVSGLSDTIMHSFAGEALSETDTKRKIVELLKIADTGISDVERIEITKENLTDDTPEEVVQDIEQGKKYATIVTEHKRFNSKLKEVKPVVFSMLRNESQGSRKMFEISPFILQSLEESRTLVIDEFDARFHPLLTQKLVELFNSTSNTKSQFIFATHDTNLLNAKLLRRDQICFAEKDKYGASHFYSLVDFKGIRNDSSFEKDYIAGRYGAIPFLGDFNSIISE